MGSVANNAEVPLPKKRSLLNKFDLPLHHLDFDYVKKCKDVKELEKIIKVLRSKEEGYYPELESCAESQLAALDSRNRLLRKGTKAMTKADLSKEEWNNIASDLSDWKGDIDKKSSNIFESKFQPTNGQLPNIRNSTKGFQNMKTTDYKDGKAPRISSLDYKSWDKFDADEECKKMDLEEEKKKEVEKRQNSSESKRKKEEMSIEELAIKSLGEIGNLTQDEREVMATREKDIGNEFYNNNKIDEAIKHYTRSIHLHSNIAGLNNRAAAYLKQCAFHKALVDLNKVLEIDPKNVKARYRRAQSFQHRNLFREALDDINEVLLKEPSHVVARHVADQLRDSISKLPKMHRIKIRDRETGKSAIKTVTEAEMLNDYKNENFVEVNDWGFPKIMCNCNGNYTNYAGIRHEDHIRYQHLSNPPKNRFELDKKQTEPVPEKYMPIALPGKKLEIIEVEKGAQESKCVSIFGPKDVSSDSSSEEDQNSCIVADMRTSKNGPSPPAANQNEKSQKTDKNSLIKDTSIPGRASSSQPSLPLATHEINVDRAKDVKSIKNFTLQDNRLINGARHQVNKGDIAVSEGRQSGAKLPCGCHEHFARFQFKKDWCELTGPKSLEQKADLLKSICPKHLIQAFGNSWDKEMLVDIYKCLLHHFSAAELQRVADYVQAIPRLDRFKINSMFLTEDDKSLAQELAKRCSVVIDSSIISAFPS